MLTKTKLLRYPHNSTTRRNQNHIDPYTTHNTKEVELQLKNTTIKNSTSLKKSNTNKNQHDNHPNHSMKEAVTNF